MHFPLSKLREKLGSKRNSIRTKNKSWEMDDPSLEFEALEAAGGANGI